MLILFLRSISCLVVSFQDAYDFLGLCNGVHWLSHLVFYCKIVFKAIGTTKLPLFFKENREFVYMRFHALASFLVLATGNIVARFSALASVCRPDRFIACFRFGLSLNF